MGTVYSLKREGPIGSRCLGVELREVMPNRVFLQSPGKLERKPGCALRMRGSCFIIVPPTRHSVYVVERVSGNVRLQRKELSDFIWWDGKGELPLSYSTRAILLRFGFIKRSLLKRVLGGIFKK